ncbi:MAG TPA: proline dehydrogenase family protein [Gaiellaceae bacterium]|nr:proline dehydrogenase family protein [Gaiellaceae bacterium]
MAIYDRAIVSLLPAVPRPIVRKISDRYIAGTGIDDAVRTVSSLNGRGMLATVDVLGEEIRSADEARAIAGAYLDVLATIERERLGANVSVKLTALGLKLDRDLARELLEQVVADARDRGSFVRIDMEDSSTTDDALALYRGLREAGHENVGVVLQAYLRRTRADVEALADLRPRVRLCKGIYVEPPELAFRDDDQVRASYARTLERLLDLGCHVGIATHDEWLIRRALEQVARRRLDEDAYEFQMLLGVREERRDQLARAGHRLRVYVPFGSHWYEYSVRRLQENPSIAGYIAGDTIRRLLALR